MAKQQNNNADGGDIYKIIQELVENKEIYHARIKASKIVNEKINENLVLIRKQCGEEKNKADMAEQRIEDLTKAEQHAGCHEYRILADLKRKDCILKEFSTLLETEFDMDSKLVEAEKIKRELRKQFADAPWLPEKRAIMNELDLHQKELARVQEEISKMDGQAKEREENLSQHEKMGFTKFCVILANYVLKSKQMEQIMKKEQQVASKLKEEIDKHKEQCMPVADDNSEEMEQNHEEEEPPQNQQGEGAEHGRHQAEKGTHRSPQQKQQQDVSTGKVPSPPKIGSSVRDDGQQRGQDIQMPEEGAEEEEEEENAMEEEEPEHEEEEEGDEHQPDEEEANEAVMVQVIPKVNNKKGSQENLANVNATPAKKPAQQKDHHFAAPMDLLFDGGHGGIDISKQQQNLLSSSFFGNATGGGDALNTTKDGDAGFLGNLFGGGDGANDAANQSFNFGSFNFQPGDSNAAASNNVFNFPFNFNSPAPNDAAAVEKSGFGSFFK